MGAAQIIIFCPEDEDEGWMVMVTKESCLLGINNNFNFLQTSPIRVIEGCPDGSVSRLFSTLTPRRLIGYGNLCQNIDFVWAENFLTDLSSGQWTEWKSLIWGIDADIAHVKHVSPCFAFELTRLTGGRGRDTRISPDSVDNLHICQTKQIQSPCVYW